MPQQVLRVEHLHSKLLFKVVPIGSAWAEAGGAGNVTHIFCRLSNGKEGKSSRFHVSWNSMNCELPA